MSAPGLMFNEVGTVKRARPRRRWRASEKGEKAWEFLVFLAWGPTPPAHGFQNPRMVIEIASKSMG